MNAVRKTTMQNLLKCVQCGKDIQTQKKIEKLFFSRGRRTCGVAYWTCEAACAVQQCFERMKGCVMCVQIRMCQQLAVAVPAVNVVLLVIVVVLVAQYHYKIISKYKKQQQSSTSRCDTWIVLFMSYKIHVFEMKEKGLCLSIFLSMWVFMQVEECAYTMHRTVICNCNQVSDFLTIKYNA